MISIKENEPIKYRTTQRILLEYHVVTNANCCSMLLYSTYYIFCFFPVVQSQFCQQATDGGLKKRYASTHERSNVMVAMPRSCPTFLKAHTLVQLHVALHTQMVCLVHKLDNTPTIMWKFEGRHRGVHEFKSGRGLQHVAHQLAHKVTVGYHDDDVRVVTLALHPGQSGSRDWGRCADRHTMFE